MTIARADAARTTDPGRSLPGPFTAPSPLSARGGDGARHVGGDRW